MKKQISIIIFFMSINTLAASKKNERHEHGAHVHGSARLSIAFDETKGRVEFKGAAKGILGFEYKPKTEKDNKALADTAARFESDITKMIQMDASLGCQFTKEMVGQVFEKGDEGAGKHSEWNANFNIICTTSPVGTKIVVDFSSFKLLEDLDITVLAGSVQKSAEFKKKPVTIELK